MKPKELNTLLLEKFPQLETNFLNVTSWQDGIDTGSTVVYEDVFIPFIEDSIAINDRKTIDCIFDFIEELSMINDEYARYILEMSIFSTIDSYKDKSPFVKEMKKNTLELYNNFEIDCNNN